MLGRGGVGQGGRCRRARVGGFVVLRQQGLAIVESRVSQRPVIVHRGVGATSRGRGVGQLQAGAGGALLPQVRLGYHAVRGFSGMRGGVIFATVESEGNPYSGALSDAAPVSAVVVPQLPTSHVPTLLLSRVAFSVL